MNTDDDAERGPDPITVDQAEAFARFTGCDLERAVSDLRKMDVTLRGRVLRALTTQDLSSGLIHDPIEDELGMKAIISRAGREAEADLQGVSYELGHCHLLWQKQTEILRTRYGITWFSTAAMNPHVMLD